MLIPDFGGFVVKPIPSSINKRNRLSPPSSALYFQPEINASNDLLLNEIIRQEKISTQEAKRKIKDFISNINESLKSKKTVKLNGVGNLYMSNNNEVKFKSDRKASFNKDSFGLPNLVLEEVNRGNEIKSTVTTKTADEKPVRKLSPWAVAFTTIASVLALLLGGTYYLLEQGSSQEQEFIRSNLGFMLTNTDQANDNNEIISPVIEKQQEEPKQETIVQTEVNTDHSINEEVKGEEIINEPVEEPQKQVIETVLPNEPFKADFHVVAGMFKKKYYAKKKLKLTREKGFSRAVMIKGQKYYRVIIPFSAKETTWRKAQQAVQETVEPEAWIWETLYQ